MPAIAAEAAVSYQDYFMALFIYLYGKAASVMLLSELSSRRRYRLSFTSHAASITAAIALIFDELLFRLRAHSFSIACLFDAYIL